MWSIKYLIFKNLIPKIKDMYLPCSTLSCNRRKLKKFSLRKTTKPLGLSGFVVILWLLYAVLLVCPAATPAPHTQQRQTVGFELFLLYQQRQKSFASFLSQMGLLANIPTKAKLPTHLPARHPCAKRRW